MMTMASDELLYGFHAVSVRMKVAPESIREIYVDMGRRDARMQRFLTQAETGSLRLIEADRERLSSICGNSRHQGVVARAAPLAIQKTLDELLDSLPEAALLLVLDGVTDPHNLGACLRVADGAGAHAVIAPKDHAVGVTPTVAKVSSGASDTVPYFMVTNLARNLRRLQDAGIWVYGASEDAPCSLYEVDLRGAVALVLGAEGRGLRQLTRKSCDELMHIPMQGAVESLNVSVAAGVCLYEARRQRLPG